MGNIYVKTNWASNDIITPERLNKLEDGIASASGGIGVVQMQYDSNAGNKLDKNYNEIVEMLNTNAIVIIKEDYFFVDFVYRAEQQGGYVIICGNASFFSSSPTGVLYEDTIS